MLVAPPRCLHRSPLRARTHRARVRRGYRTARLTAASGDWAPMRRTGILTTDANLVIRSWDVSGADHGGRGREGVRTVTGVAGTRSRHARCLALLRDTLASGAVTVLAPAIHHFLIACDPIEPSGEFDRMQQRVVVTPLSNDLSTVGLAISIEDVTGRLERERRLARALATRIRTFAARPSRISARTASTVPDRWAWH